MPRGCPNCGKLGTGGELCRKCSNARNWQESQKGMCMTGLPHPRPGVMTMGGGLLGILIQMYQRYAVVNRAVRIAVRVHHRLRPRPGRGPCPVAGRCSATGLAEAHALGMAALPLILARMSVCGVASDDCKGGDMCFLNTIGGPCGGPKGPPKSWEGDGC